METKQTDVKQTEEKKMEPKQTKKKGANPFRSNKFKRGGMATLMTVVFIAIVVALNVVVSALTQRFPSMDIDMTAQGLNTLSDQAVEIAKGVDQDTTIYLIGTEEAYENNQIGQSYLSYYGVELEYNQVASLAKRLAETNPKISVEFVDPDTNPTFVSEYADDNLTTGKVLVKTEKRHRVLTVSDMFSIEQGERNTYYSYDSEENTAYSMVDSALASALELVNMEDVPVFTIATGHGEILTSDNMSSFLGMVEDQNFEVQEIDLLTEEIPEGTQVLMLPTPTSDYSDEEVAKLRAYLDDTTTEEPVTVLATAWPQQASLPNYSAFLEEWGVSVEPGVVVESDTSRMAVADQSGILVNASSEDILADNSYNRLVSYYSSPLNLLFDANNNVVTYELWTTNDTAYVITEDTTEADVENPTTSTQTVATYSYKSVEINDSYYSRSLMVFGYSNGFTDTFMNSAFDNGTYLTDLVLFATGNDGSNVSVTTQRVETNVMDITATRSTMDMWGIILAGILPVAILAAGLVIFLKRRHL